MFGMSFTEIMVIAIIAILFLGPDKLPQAMVKIAKFFKTFKNSINDAKHTLEHEVKIHELKEDAKTYKDKLAKGKQELESSINIDAFEDARAGISDLKDTIDTIKDSTDIKKQVGKLVDTKVDKDA